ncbi:MAG: hypothetical protein PHI63_05575 [Patescibacteria group bacterium]|nr:hypothetical protein [Patescibacteria group bacterium]
MAKVYACTGSCKAIIKVEQFEQGLTKCGAKGCTMRGHDFRPVEQCPDCALKFAEGKLQTCPECRPL